MPKEEQNEPYCVSISDWISILKGKTSDSLTLLIFTATIFFAIIVGLPPTITDNLKSNELVWLITFVVLIFVYFIFKIVHKRLQKETERYEILLNDILYGKITDVTKIRDRYKEIEGKNKEQN